MSRNAHILLFFIILALSASLQLVSATTTNFTVNRGEEEVKSVNLSVEDHVVIKFTVVGSAEDAIDFYMTYPNGTVKNFGSVGYFHYSFVCDLEGKYELHFSNLESVEDKLVALDYEVDHYIFGIPQMLFLAIIIAVVCVAAVAAFVLMGKPH
jgi:hypothetical protein